MILSCCPVNCSARISESGRPGLPAPIPIHLRLLAAWLLEFPRSLLSQRSFAMASSLVVLHEGARGQTCRWCCLQHVVDLRLACTPPRPTDTAQETLHSSRSRTSKLLLLRASKRRASADVCAYSGGPWSGDDAFCLGDAETNGTRFHTVAAATCIMLQRRCCMCGAESEPQTSRLTSTHTLNPLLTCGRGRSWRQCGGQDGTRR